MNVAWVNAEVAAAMMDGTAESVTGASGGGADNKLSAVAVHLDLDSALTQPPDIPDEKPTTEGAAPPHIHIDRSIARFPAHDTHISPPLFRCTYISRVSSETVVSLLFFFLGGVVPTEGPRVRHCHE